MRLKQMVYQNPSESNKDRLIDDEFLESATMWSIFNPQKVFYCYILFVLNFLFQLFRLFTSMIKKKFNFDSLMNLTFIILDSAVMYLMISTITETSKAIAAFELDPRSRPPFDVGRVHTCLGPSSRFLWFWRGSNRWVHWKSKTKSIEYRGVLYQF